MKTLQPDIASHFESLKDPRVEGKNQHLLIDIIIIAICGVVSGAFGWVRILPNGRIDLLSVNESARLQANMIAQFQNKAFRSMVDNRGSQDVPKGNTPEYTEDAPTSNKLTLLLKLKYHDSIADVVGSGKAEKDWNCFLRVSEISIPALCTRVTIYSIGTCARYAGHVARRVLIGRFR